MLDQLGSPLYRAHAAIHTLNKYLSNIHYNNNYNNDNNYNNNNNNNKENYDDDDNNNILNTNSDNNYNNINNNINRNNFGNKKIIMVKKEKINKILLLL